MFPRDTQQLYVDASSTSQILMATSSNPITILNISAMCNATNGDREVSAGTTSLLDMEVNTPAYVSELRNNVIKNTSIKYTNSQTNQMCAVYIQYVPRDRTITPDPTEQYATTTPVTLGTSTLYTYVTNFPTSFNVGNFPALQNVNCTIGCNASSTLILSSSTVNVLTTSAPTFNEWLFICGVFLAINSIHLWNFIFKKPQKVK
jgi:hypothetical protein